MAGFFVFHHGEIFFPYNNITALLFITLWSSGENNFLCSRTMNYVLLDGGNFLLIKNYPAFCR